MKLRAALWGTVAGVLAVTLVLALPAREARAAAIGPCAATVNGTDVNLIDTPGTALEVDYSDNVTATVTAPVPFASHKVEMWFSVIGWTVSEETDNSIDTSVSTTVAVAKYAKWGR